MMSNKSRCTISVLYGLLLADRLNSSSNRQERTHGPSPTTPPSPRPVQSPHLWALLHLFIMFEKGWAIGHLLEVPSATKASFIFFKGWAIGHLLEVPTATKASFNLKWGQGLFSCSSWFLFDVTPGSNWSHLFQSISRQDYVLVRSSKTNILPLRQRIHRGLW